MPIGVKLFGKIVSFPANKEHRRTLHKILVLLITFIAYAAYHMGRRPITIVKNALHHDCKTNVSLHHQLNNINNNNNIIVQEQNQNLTAIATIRRSISDESRVPLTQAFEGDNHESDGLLITPSNNSCDNWAPFDDDQTANKLFAIVDTSFLAAYALGMFFSGFIAERTNLRHFITIGCGLSGLGLITSGLAHTFDIHSLTFFIMAQIVSGAAQSTGWPVVVACVGNWFNKSERGLVYSLWNSHTNLGNILGALIAGYFVNYNWGLSFMVPGCLMILVAFVLYLFLVPSPSDVGLANLEPNNTSDSDRATTTTKTNPANVSNVSISTNVENLSPPSDDETQSELTRCAANREKAVSFLEALVIPGVIEFSMCLFFSKLVSYTFLYWLPKYIAATTDNDSRDSAYMSIWFEVGGVVGSVLAGWLSDRYNSNGIICDVMLVAAMPAMFAYQRYGSRSTLLYIGLQTLAGLFVNGPYCLITTSVSADLGDRIKDGHAIATVAAIIDGMGSVGAVVGPLIAGFISDQLNWESVFDMLIISNALAAICLARVVIYEAKKLYQPSTTQDSNI